MLLIVARNIATHVPVGRTWGGNFFPVEHKDEEIIRSTIILTPCFLTEVKPATGKYRVQVKIQWRRIHVVPEMLQVQSWKTRLLKLRLGVCIYLTFLSFSIASGSEMEG